LSRLSKYPDMFAWLSRRRETLFRRLAAVSVLLSLFGMYQIGSERGLDHRLGIEAWGRAVVAIAGAFTDKGYALSTAVEDAIYSGGLTDRADILLPLGLQFPENLQMAAVIDTSILKGLAVRNEPSTVRPPAGDDLGLIDFAKLGFALFGPNLRALYLTYFVLLAASICAYFAMYRDDAVCLAVLVLAVAASLLLFASSVFDLTSTTLGSPVNARFLGTLAILPGLHLGAAMVLRLPVSLMRLGLTALQASIFVLACSIRSPAIWLALALLLLALWVGWRKWSFRPLWNLGILSAVFFLHTVYVSTVLNPVFREAGAETHHVFWHTVFYSLTLTPEWKERYAARFDNARNDDISVVATRKYLAQHPLANPADAYDPATHDLKWSVIDSTMRKVFFQILSDDPTFVLSTFLFYNPLSLLRGLGGYLSTVDRLSFPWWIVVASSYFGVAAYLARREADCRALVRVAMALTGAFLVSLGPVLATVAYTATIADQFLMLLLAGSSWVVALMSLGLTRLVSTARISPAGRRDLANSHEEELQ
jgi:hypothetical protein